MRLPTPRKLRSGKASRNSVINFMTAARPFFGSCIGWWTHMSNVASSFTILGFQGFPQNSLNQRAAVFLFSCIGSPPYIVIRERHSQPRSYARGTFANISGPPDFRVGLEHSHEDDSLNVVSYSVIGWLAGQSLLL